MKYKQKERVIRMVVNEAKWLRFKEMYGNKAQKMFDLMLTEAIDQTKSDIIINKIFRKK